MALDADEALLKATADVVVRYRGHGSYRDRAGAIRALRKRATGYTPDQIDACLQFLCQVYDRAVVAIREHPASSPNPANRCASPEDIDQAACLAELDGIEPGVGLVQKQEILGWVIYWHYLR